MSVQSGKRNRPVARWIISTHIRGMGAKFGTIFLRLWHASLVCFDWSIGGHLTNQNFKQPRYHARDITRWSQTTSFWCAVSTINVVFSKELILPPSIQKPLRRLRIKHFAWLALGTNASWTKKLSSRRATTRKIKLIVRFIRYLPTKMINWSNREVIDMHAMFTALLKLSWWIKSWATLIGDLWAIEKSSFN